MKRMLTVICIMVAILLMLSGCVEKKEVQFKEFYSEIIVFSNTDGKSKSVPEDAVLMINDKDFQQFKEEYFTPREIPVGSPEHRKAVLFLQIESPTSSVNRYIVKSITVKNNTLIVKVKGTSVSQVDGVDGFNGPWEWVMFVEVDKKDLKQDMKIIVKR